MMQSVLKYFGFGGNNQQQESTTTNANPNNDGIKGTTKNRDSAVKSLYAQMHVEHHLVSAIMDIRYMDREDTRVKKIHNRMTRDATKGGVRLVWHGEENKRVTALWKEYQRNIKINKRAKLLSDARGLVKEGNLALQWVFNGRKITAGVKMPTETIIPDCGDNGQFNDIQAAYKHVDPITQQTLCTFALWQLSVTRLDPDNFDDQSSLGRPYLDAGRAVWKKLNMTETDLVVRRRTRAAQKLSHSFTNADKETILAYQAEVESDSGDITTDFYGTGLTVTAIGGDSNLDQIADVSYLLDTFFAGAPAPKGLFGYTGEIARDILEDLKKDYFEEIDLIQDMLSDVYRDGFELQLLLAGINPHQHDFSIQIAERQTESRNQKADLGLKYQAMGMPQAIVNDVAGIDNQRYNALKDAEKKNKEPYPEEDENDDPPNKQAIKITPGNARKGESATSVSS